MKKTTFNMLTAAPLALWGGIISFILRVLMDINSTVQKLNLFISIALMNIIFILYYILLNNYLKSQPKDITNYRLYCIICSILGTAFTVILFVVTNYKH